CVGVPRRGAGRSRSPSWCRRTRWPRACAKRAGTWLDFERPADSLPSPSEELPLETPLQTTTAGPDATDPAPSGEPLAFDVAVAGGGVGGMALATRLARAGHRVAVVERTRPGTFRVGESLDWEAPVFLGRLGFDVSRWVEEGKATFKGGAVVSNVAQPRVRAEIGFSLPFRALMRL